MKLLSLNCRELGNHDAVGGLRNLLRREALDLVFLCETKLSGCELRRMRACLTDYDGTEVDSVGKSGGLAFLWKKDVKCSFRSASVHHMDFIIAGDEGDWRVSGFYGWPMVSDRDERWVPSSVADDKFYGSGRDVSFEGYEFTYDNGQVGADNRQSRIDRAMGNEKWFDMFPRAKLIHMDREWSDHAPIKVILRPRPDREVRGGKIFRFEQIWVGEDGCEDAIRKAWDMGYGDLPDAIRKAWDMGYGDLPDLLLNCVEKLTEWKGLSIGKIMRDIQAKRRRLKQLNEGNRSARALKERKRIVQQIATLLKQEELFWRQQSRAFWLREGDRNTKYFHQKAGQRKNKNHIAKLVDDEGREHIGTEAVAHVAKSYFEELFSSSGARVDENLLDVIAGRVTPDMNEGLRAAYREEEVITALNQMHPLKSPGPDGMNGLFFQTYWHIVGPLVVKTVLDILRGQDIPPELNKTQIVLIPKKKAPDKIVDFRPISLCNVVYKLVSKVLANRLKVFLGNIVSENQSAFTPGRWISDNILVAFELFHHMKNTRQGDGHMALKRDMAKAYDRVEWNFLERVLRRMGFDDSWTDNVMKRVARVSF
ncbi:uncharacterized protein LOC141655470 [Silene latifolia]|uniref:uncharacterized protein LOC141655470 n=1 Tax=Silene latifolia TaxID=37657 RepID=UPI003D76ED39